MQGGAYFGVGGFAGGCLFGEGKIRQEREGAEKIDMGYVSSQDGGVDFPMKGNQVQRGSILM